MKQAKQIRIKLTKKQKFILANTKDTYIQVEYNPDTNRAYAHFHNDENADGVVGIDDCPTLVTRKPNINTVAMRFTYNLTREQMASILQVSPITIGNWERGELFPNRKNTQKIHELYDILDKIRRQDKDTPFNSIRELIESGLNMQDLAYLVRGASY